MRENMSVTFKSFLTEKMNPVETHFVNSLVHLLSTNLDVEEMPSGRGERKATGTIEIRLKPKDVEQKVQDLLDKLHSTINKHAKKLDVKNIKTNKLSPNSSKFPSVSFDQNAKTYDIVMAKGANKGEKYESDLLDDLESHVAGLDSSEAPRLLAAIERADKKFRVSDVVAVSGRTGSTRRSGSSDVGAIIADIILTMENGDKKYLSIKNKLGATFANLGGVSTLFDNDFNIDTSHDIWKILKEFGFSADKITKGFQAFVSGEEVDFEVNVLSSKTIKVGGAIENFLKDAWGYNYYYVREHSHDFTVMNMTKSFIAKTLLSDLKIQEIRYPYSDSKQISVKFGNKHASYKFEIRNPHGARAIKPTDAKIKITRLDLG